MALSWSLSRWLFILKAFWGEPDKANENEINTKVFKFKLIMAHNLDGAQFLT